MGTQRRIRAKQSQVMLSALRAAAPRRLLQASSSRAAPAALQVRMFADSSYLDSKEVEERVMSVLSGFEKVEVAKLTTSAHFKNDLGLDSLDTVEVVMAIEEEFSVEIPDADAEKIQSCEEAIKYIAAHPQAK